MQKFGRISTSACTVSTSDLTLRWRHHSHSPLSSVALFVFSLDCFWSPDSSSLHVVKPYPRGISLEDLSLPPFSILLDLSRHISPYLEEAFEGPLCARCTGTLQTWISVVNKPPFQFHQNQEEDGDGSQKSKIHVLFGLCGHTLLITGRGCLMPDNHECSCWAEAGRNFLVHLNWWLLTPVTDSG